MLDQLSALVSVGIWLLDISNLETTDSKLYFYLKDRLVEVINKIGQHEKEV